MAFTDKIYFLDFNQLASWLTKQSLRKNKIIAFATTLVAHINVVYSSFNAYKTQTVYWLGIDSLVCNMQRALNDRYDIEQRRITITDGASVEAWLLSLKDENKPFKLGLKSNGDAPVLIPLKKEVSAFSSDFVVNVPKDIAFNKNEMKAIIDTIKTPTKTYLIKIF